MKKIDKILDYTYLSDVIAYANTPMYVFERFKTNESILEFTLLKTEDIIAFFDNAYKLKKKDIKDYVKIYSCIVALILKNDKSVEKFLNSLPQLKIKWAENFFRIYKSRVIIDNQSNYDLEYNVINFSYLINTLSNTEIIKNESNS